MGANTNDTAVPSTEKGPTAASDGPKPEASNAPLTIRFVDQAGNELSFKLKPSTLLKKAMDMFAQKQQLAVSSLRFMFDGTKVVNDSTPDDLDMEDGSQVDVFTEQIGGGSYHVETGRNYGVN